MIKGALLILFAIRGQKVVGIALAGD